MSKNNTIETVMTVVVIAIALIVGVYVFGAIADTTPRTQQNDVVNESFTVNVGNYVDLNNTHLESGSETVYNSTDAEMTNGVDYEMNYTDGSIKALSGNNLTDGNSATISYTYNDHMKGYDAVVSNFGSAATLLAVGIIVLAAAFILTILISRFAGGM